MPFTEEVTFLRTSVVRFRNEAADTSFAPGSSFPGLVQVCLTPWFGLMN